MSTCDNMTYTAKRATPAHAWIITTGDGTEVIALPYDLPALVAKAVACAFATEVERNTR